MAVDLKTVIVAAGGPRAVGRAFGISSQAVSQWERCPAERVLTLAHLAGIEPWHIRPDLYPMPERESA